MNMNTILFHRCTKCKRPHPTPQSRALCKVCEERSQTRYTLTKKGKEVNHANQ